MGRSGCVCASAGHRSQWVHLRPRDGSKRRVGEPICGAGAFHHQQLFRYQRGGPAGICAPVSAGRRISELLRPSACGDSDADNQQRVHGQLREGAGQDVPGQRLGDRDTAYGAAILPTARAPAQAQGGEQPAQRDVAVGLPAH